LTIAQETVLSSKYLHPSIITSAVYNNHLLNLLRLIPKRHYLTMVYNHVNKGNTILVPAESLGGEERKKITVSWSQWLGTRSQEYYVCNYTVASSRT